MRILGIDPGLRRTGFGVIDIDGQRVAYKGSGMIRPDITGTEPERLAELFHGVQELIEHYRPDHAVIERVFVNVNPKSTLSLGQARGVAIAALAQAALPVDEITPLKIKQSIVGSGRATKEQVQKMVQRLLALPKAPGADAADALACALAWWQTQAHRSAVDKASGRR
ncbi:MAG: crossover junction endodeoxyribonuclease RuvC [Burkholderiaceae bacterium]|nr:crossover junction endodeoxyribonuclease RuvC [Burkholderiaceae bacterium]